MLRLDNFEQKRHFRHHMYVALFIYVAIIYMLAKWTSGCKKRDQDVLDIFGRRCMVRYTSFCWLLHISTKVVHWYTEDIRYFLSIDRDGSSTTPIFPALFVTEIEVSHTSMAVILVAYMPVLFVLWGEQTTISVFSSFSWGRLIIIQFLSSVTQDLTISRSRLISRLPSRQKDIYFIESSAYIE